MGNKHDGDTSKPNNEKISAYGEDGLEIYGNSDAKKLSKAYKELSKDGLSESDKQTLKKMDDALKGAEFHCLDSEVTLVTQHENHTETSFVVLGHGLKQNAGFISNKPVKQK